MKESTIKKYTEIISKIKSSGKSVRAYCSENNISYDTLRKTIASLKNSNNTQEEEKLLNLYKECVETDNKAVIKYIRDDNKKILYYEYKIFRRDKTPLCGNLTRQEMDSIHRLYSYYGDSLTQRVISRNFPELSLIDFKRILRAFNITKASSPFAPHMIEEYSEDELRDIQLREKENSFLRKAEEDNIRNNEKLLKKYAQENIELKNSIDKFINFASLGIKTSFDDSYLTSIHDISNTLVIALSDMHVGAYNTTNGYMELPIYDESEINKRLNKVLEFINNSQYIKLVVLNLGDSVDSFNKETTRGGHPLPGILSDKEMSTLYLKVMMRFFNSIKNRNIEYYCVGESNHDGFVGWMNNLLLANKLEQKGIKCYISNTPSFNLNINDVSLTVLHGKDDHNQFKNFPLVINPNTENWFNNYYLNTDFPFKKRKIVLKGDLHQYAYTCGKAFDYMSCPSLYGSSQWIVANFGITKWGIGYLNIDSNNNVNSGVISSE